MDLAVDALQGSSSEDEVDAKLNVCAVEDALDARELHTEARSLGRRSSRLSRFLCYFPQAAIVLHRRNCMTLVSMHCNSSRMDM